MSIQFIFPKYYTSRHVLLNSQHFHADWSIGSNTWLLHGDNCHLAHVSTNDSLAHSRTKSITSGRLLIRADVTLALTLQCIWRQQSEIQREETKVSIRMKSFWTLQQAETERAKWFIARYTLHNDVKLNVDTRYRRAQIVLIWSVCVIAANAKPLQPHRRRFWNWTLPFKALINGGEFLTGRTKFDVVNSENIVPTCEKPPTWWA